MTNKRYCYIFCAAQTDKNLKFIPVPGKDYIIAADAGYRHLTSHGIKPDLLIGDLDSLGEAPSGVEILRFPVMKDDTDLMLAVKHGFSLGFTDFIIYGAMGGKLDFTLANFQILAGILNLGGSAYFIGCGSLVTAVKNCTLEFDKTFIGRVSIFASSECADGVTLNGLKYTLNNAVLRYDNPLGISNEFIGKSGSISVKSGILTVIYDDVNNMMKTVKNID